MQPFAAWAQSAAPTILDEIVVDGPAGASATGEPDANGQTESETGPVKRYVAKKSRTATKSDTPLIEVPRSVNVIGAEEIEDRGGAQTLIDTLSYTPGFFTSMPGLGRANANISLRGFSTFSSLYLDGLALPTGLDRANPQIEPYGLERIEVMKGPASILYGQSSSGGLINMVSKRPTFERLREVQFQYGSFDRKQTAFDFSDTIDAAGTLAYRLTGLLQDSDTQTDFTEDKRLFIAPSVSWKQDEDTTLTLLGHYRRNTGIDQFTATLPPDVAAEVPRNRFIGAPGFDRNDATQYSIGYEFNHRFDETWQVFSSGRYLALDTDYRTMILQGPTNDPNDAPSVISRTPYLLDEQSNALTFDNRVQADFTTGPVTHKTIVGLDYRNQQSENVNGYWYKGEIYDADGNLVDQLDPFDLLNPDYGARIPNYGMNGFAVKDLNQVGLYAQEQAKWDRFVLSLGGRHDWAEGSTDFPDTAYDDATTDGAFTGNAGLLYLFDNGLAPYASFSQSFVPVAGKGRNGVPFEPTRGEQYEVGLKYAPPGLDAFFTVAAFDITQKNMLTYEMENPNDPDSNFIPKQTGEVRVRGVEVEAKASLDALDVTAAYSYLDGRITEDEDNQGNRMAEVPRHLASLWLDYNFRSGVLEGLRLGGGVRYVGSSFGDDANTAFNGSATYFDLAAGYDFGARNPNMKGLRFDVSVTNVADETPLYCDSYGCQYGKRRTVLGTLGYKW